MLGRGWGGSSATAVSVGGIGSATQLGLAYGLGIIAWNPSVDAATGGAWLAGLAWITWIAISSTMLGAIVADRLAGGRTGVAPRHEVADPATSPHPATNLTWRLALAVSGAAGALLTVPLAALPASAVHRTQAYAPQAVAVGYALVGIVLGLLAALAALSARAIALNVMATAGWLWLVAMLAVINGVAAGREIGTAQLAVWRFGRGSWSIRDTLLISDILLMLGSALLIGALCAWWPARRGDSRVAVAVSGAVGPLLVASAYFLAAPNFTVTTAGAELSPYLIAPYAVIAGLAGSVLATAFSDRHWGWPALTGPVGPVGPGTGAKAGAQPGAESGADPGPKTGAESGAVAAGPPAGSPAGAAPAGVTADAGMPAETAGPDAGAAPASTGRSGGSVAPTDPATPERTGSSQARVGRPRSGKDR